MKVERYLKQQGRSLIFLASLGEFATAFHSWCNPSECFCFLSGKSLNLCSAYHRTIYHELGVLCAKANTLFFLCVSTATINDSKAQETFLLKWIKGKYIKLFFFFFAGETGSFVRPGPRERQGTCSICIMCLHVCVHQPGELCAQSAAEPEKALCSLPGLSCLVCRWSMRKGIGWSGVSVINLVINS